MIRKKGSQKRALRLIKGLLVKKSSLFLLLFSTLINTYNNRLEQPDSSVVYAPWRDSYVNPKKERPDSLSKKSCPFCACIKQNNDKQELILQRYKYYFVALPIAPYTKGHLLIIPYKHIKQLSDLSNEECLALISLINESIDILNQTLQPDGINIGINLGKAAGASIPDHLHIHVVPRYNKSSTSFFNLIGKAHFIGFDINSLYERLQPHFK